MKTNNATSTNRTNTDTSLKNERKKADRSLSNKIHNVELASDKKIATNREIADSKKKKDRKSKTNLETPLNRTIEIERKASDVAIVKAREEADMIIEDERSSKKKISESSIHDDRNDTDVKLLCERDGNDNDLNGQSNLLSNVESKLLTRDQYLAIVSHDLKTPLSSIMLSTGIMRFALDKDVLDKTKIIKSILTIEKNVVNMDKMITDLLDIEKMSSDGFVLKKGLSNINELFEDCKILFLPEFNEKNINFQIEVEGNLNHEIDRDRVFQVISNLVGNSLKFTPTGGHITLKAEKIKEQLKISVTDNGKGIEPEMQTKIFDKFSQVTLHDRRGIGLVLFISKLIVEAHHGDLKVISSPGNGSNFYFIFP